MALDADQYRLSEAEHQRIFERRIKPQIFADAKTSDQPVAIIFGGQPGAGKSMTVDAAVAELAPRGGAAQIIGDDMRGYHPQYARLMARDDKTAAFYTDRDTGKWVEMAIAHAKTQRVNVVIEGTMRDGDKVAATMGSLRAAGYQIDARALAVNERLSEQGILQRYENQKLDRGTGRMTAPEAHRAAYVGMLDTVERIERDKLADRLTIYRRGAEVVYSNELRDGQWTGFPQGRAAIEAERSRPMTLQERREYAAGFDKLAALVARPERQAGADEIQKFEQLRQRAAGELAAEVFKQQPAAEAIKTHPELAGAYAALAAIDKQAAADGLTPQQRAQVAARSRENIAAHIERGDIPEVRVREEMTARVERGYGPER